MDASIKYARGTVWTANLPDDFEEGVQAGTRPILIVSSNQGNTTSPSVLAVPLTSKPKKNISVNVSWICTENNVKTMALCSQIRPLNKGRLIQYKYTLSDEYMQKVESSMRLALDLDHKEKVRDEVLNTSSQSVNNTQTIENLLRLNRDEVDIRKSYEYMCEILLAAKNCIQKTTTHVVNTIEQEAKEPDTERPEVDGTGAIEVEDKHTKSLKPAKEYIEELLEINEDTSIKPETKKSKNKWTEETIKQFILDSDTKTSGLSVEDVMYKYNIGTKSSYYTLKSKFKKKK